MTVDITAVPRRIWLPLVAMVLIAMAAMRPLDHDESQYVAAAVLTAHGLLPYRDYAFLQTPLQPLLLAPIAYLAGPWTWPALRAGNALFGAVAIGFVHAAARARGASRRAALAIAILFACTDALLFSAATARNDALPAALLAWALWLIVRTERDGGTAIRAAMIGLLLSAATAAKVSYALPAATYGLLALLHREHRPWWVAAGAVPMVALVAGLWALAPEQAAFGIYVFPAEAPTQFYLAQGRTWKLSTVAKLVDFAKFLALGPALLGLVVVARRISKRPTIVEWLLLAGVIAALLPTPTWRQYLLPLLPALFIVLAQRWTERPPARWLRITTVVFAVAGLAPSIVATIDDGDMVDAVQEGAAVKNSMDAAHLRGPVATLSPQFLPAIGRLPDPRFAAGPFYFRSRGLLTQPEEQRLHLVSRDTIGRAPLPPTVLVGGEGGWTSGDEQIDLLLERRAIAAGYRRYPVAGGRLRLYGAPR